MTVYMFVNNILGQYIYGRNRVYFYQKLYSIIEKKERKSNMTGILQKVLVQRKIIHFRKSQFLLFYEAGTIL